MAAISSAKKKSKKSKSRRLPPLHKPNGVLHPRVEQAGPTHFGIVSVDCAKGCSKWMLCDFYGKLLLPPADLPHNQCHFLVAIEAVKKAVAQHQLKDFIVAIERTGNYHLPVKRAFAGADFECRIVHPLISKHFRQAANPGNKTDDTDLNGIHRAAVNGFGFRELTWGPLWKGLQLLVRHRRDLVEKRSALCCQIQEHLEAMLPGYVACFHGGLWNSHVGMHVARNFPSPAAVRDAGVAGLSESLKATGQRCHPSTLERLVGWAAHASTPAEEAVLHHRIMTKLDDDRLAKTDEIQALEQDIAASLVQTPYVLMLSLPGINVVSSAELAAEAGPIENYPTGKAITGRAGLFPARYQSHQVDRADGKILRCGNRRLRAALLMVSDNLLKCNAYFRMLNENWQRAKKDTHDGAGVAARIKVASRLARIMFHMLARRELLRHPGMKQRDYVLDKLLEFHRLHGMPPAQILTNLEAAIAQLPQNEYALEAKPLLDELHKSKKLNKRGPKPIGDLLLPLLARLGVSSVKSQASGEQDPS
jgi:transposase